MAATTQMMAVHSTCVAVQGLCLTLASRPTNESQQKPTISQGLCVRFAPHKLYRQDKRLRYLWTPRRLGHPLANRKTLHATLAVSVEALLSCKDVLTPSRTAHPYMKVP